MGPGEAFLWVLVVFAAVLALAASIAVLKGAVRGGSQKAGDDAQQVQVGTVVYSSGNDQPDDIDPLSGDQPRTY